MRGAGRLAGDPEDIRDPLLRLERDGAPHANAAAVTVALHTLLGRDVDPRLSHWTPPFVIGSASRIFRSLSSGRTFSSSAMSMSDRRSASARFTRAADFAYPMCGDSAVAISDGLESMSSFTRPSSTRRPSIVFVRSCRTAFARIVAEKHTA